MFASSALVLFSVIGVACAVTDHLVPVGDGDGGASATVTSSADATTPSATQDASATTQDASATTQDASATTQDASATTQDASATTQDASATTVATVSTAVASTTTGMMCPVGFGDCDGLGCTTLLDADPDHCGACGHTCLGGACTGGACEPLVVASVGLIRDFAIDGDDIYFGEDNGAGNVRRVAKDGGPTSILTATEAPRALTFDATHVYWIEYSIAQPGYRRLVRVPKAGGARDVLVGFTNGPASVAVDGTSAHYVTGAAVVSLLLGGASTTLATEPAYEITYDAGTLFWSTMGGANNGTIRSKVVGAAGMPTTLAVQQGNARMLAVFQGQVYWTTDGTVMRVPIVGGPPVAISSDALSPGDIAVDASGIYWVQAGDATHTRGIWKADHGGGAPTLFRATSDYPPCLGLDGDAVYWTEGLDLLRIPKI